VPDAQKRSDAAKRTEARASQKPKPGSTTNGATKLAPDLIALAEQVILSERLDAHLAEWQRRGQVGFFLPAGEWAAALAGLCAALDPIDWLFPGMREARTALHRGMPLSEYLAQHLGLEPGTLAPEASCAGHAQPGALCDAPHRVASVPSGVANHLPHAVGAAMAARKLKTNGCAVAICGQAALDAADFHVAANFAGVFKAPVLMVIRADQALNGSGPPRGVISPRAREEAVAPVLARASAYGLDPASVEGGDSRAVREAVRAALAKARSGRPGLLVLEAPSVTKKAGARFPELGEARLSAMTREADAFCERAFATARDGVRPALPSLTRAVFAEESRALAEERRDLAGEQPVPFDEV
jgi:TPP-dependent pyruvate/acetoin dehydrogenase alpha subunit